MSRKLRKIIAEQKSNERKNSFKGKRKQTYKEMADEEAIGRKELKKYCDLWDTINRNFPDHNFPSPDKIIILPKQRTYYNNLRIFYRMNWEYID